MTKETDRERIAREVKAFVSGGGKIEVVEYGKAKRGPEWIGFADMKDYYESLIERDGEEKDHG